MEVENPTGECPSRVQSPRAARDPTPPRRENHDLREYLDDRRRDSEIGTTLVIIGVVLPLNEERTPLTVNTATVPLHAEEGTTIEEAVPTKIKIDRPVMTTERTVATIIVMVPTTINEIEEQMVEFRARTIEIRGEVMTIHENATPDPPHPVEIGDAITVREAELPTRVIHHPHPCCLPCRIDPLNDTMTKGHLLLQEADAEHSHPHSETYDGLKSFDQRRSRSMMEARTQRNSFKSTPRFYAAGADDNALANYNCTTLIRVKLFE
jgi:hypothetical protein